MAQVSGFASKLRPKDFLLWSVAAVLGLGAVSLPEFITPRATSRTGWFTLGAIGLLMVGALLGFCQPKRAWRWGLGSVLLFPVFELVTTRGELAYVFVKLPIYALQALPALLGAYLGALAGMGVPTAERLSEGAKSARVWVLGFLLGALTGWTPRLVVEDGPFDRKISYLIWWAGLFLSTLVVGYLRPDRPVRATFTVVLGFTIGIIAECVGYSPCNLLPFVILFAVLVAALPTFSGAYLGKFVNLKLAKRSAETEKSPSGSRYVGMILNAGIAVSLFGVVLFIANTPKSGEELRRAAIKGDVETVRSLLSKGANLNWRAGGWTILMFVSREGRTEIAKILLEHGADPNVKGREGATAVTISAEHGHAELVKVLLGGGADVNGKNDHGNTALMYGAEYGHLEVVKALLNAGADVSARDRDGETALMMARRRGHTEIVELLKNAGAKE